MPRLPGRATARAMHPPTAQGCSGGQRPALPLGMGDTSRAGSIVNGQKKVIQQRATKEACLRAHGQQ